ncbi:MAG: M16 family metallopeptidase [Terriglobia bacterium]
MVLRWWITPVLLVVLSVLLGARLPARELPPLVPPPPAMVMPEPSFKVLANGLKVVALERHALPIVTLTFTTPAGSAADPPHLAGMAQFVAALLNEGTRDRSALQIAEAIDDAGGTIDTGADWDDSYARLSVLADHTGLAFDLLSDITIRPAFAPDEVERIRKQIVSALDILHDDPSYLADTMFERVVFQGTTYSHPPEGVEGSIQRITSKDLRRFHARYYRPANSALVVVGDISTTNAFDLAQRFFGHWRGGKPFHLPHVSPISRLARRVVVIDDPEAVQTEIRIGNAAIDRDNPDYDALTVANQILGGPAENLLFSALRSRRGLVYGASSDLVCYRNAGDWEAQTSTETSETIKTVELMLDQMKRVAGRDMDREDLQLAQNYLVGHMALEFETSPEITDQLVSLLTYNLPLDYWNSFPAQIRGLTDQKVAEATGRYLKPEKADIVLVGNASGFKKNLKKLGAAQIIPIGEIDFASATLEQPHATLASSHYRY